MTCVKDRWKVDCKLLFCLAERDGVVESVGVLGRVRFQDHAPCRGFVVSRVLSL